MSRQKPSNEEVIEAIKATMSGHGSVARFEDIRLGTQRHLKTVQKSAREWMWEALTDPAQTELVFLHSNDSKYTYRIVLTDSGSYSYYGDLLEGKNLMMRLDRHGCLTDSSDDAVRNVNWVMRRSTLDVYIAKLLKQEEEEKTESDKEKEAENAKVEQIIGAELSLIRGMFAAADITPDERTLTAWAQQVHKIENNTGKTVRRARATIELDIRKLVKLAKWLQEQGIEPVTATGKDNES